MLEETLHREKLKWAATEQAMKDLEQQFTDKERNWKVVEEELRGTISELQQQLRKQTCEEKAVKTPAAEAFSRMLSTSEGKSELLCITRLKLALTSALYFSQKDGTCQFTFSFITARCIMTGGHSSPPYVNRKNKFTVVLQATKICTFILLLFTKLMILFV